MTIHRRKDMEMPGKPSKIQTKREILDLHRKIQMPVGAFLVLLEAGVERQIDLEHNRAKSSLLKYGPDMRKFAEHLLDEKLIHMIEEYLDSIDSLIHTPINLIDEAKISKVFETNQQLEKHLKMH